MKINAMLANRERLQINSAKQSKDASAQNLHLLTAVLALGILFGVLIYLTRRTLLINHLLELIISFHTSSTNSSFIRRLVSFFCQDTLWFILMLICGTSLFGNYAIYGLLFLKASGIGALACLYTQNFQAENVGAYFICVFPGKILLLLILLMMGQNCTHMCQTMRKDWLQQGSANTRSISLFAARSGVVYGILIISDFLNAALPSIFNLPFYPLV